jgi:hypothetical protein
MREDVPFCEAESLASREAGRGWDEAEDGGVDTSCLAPALCGDVRGASPGRRGMGRTGIGCSEQNRVK